MLHADWTLTGVCALASQPSVFMSPFFMIVAAIVYDGGGCAALACLQPCGGHRRRILHSVFSGHREIDKMNNGPAVTACPTARTRPCVRPRAVDGEVNTATNAHGCSMLGGGSPGDGRSAVRAGSGMGGLEALLEGRHQPNVQRRRRRLRVHTKHLTRWLRRFLVSPSASIWARPTPVWACGRTTASRSSRTIRATARRRRTSPSPVSVAREARVCCFAPCFFFQITMEFRARAFVTRAPGHGCRALSRGSGPPQSPFV